MDEAIVGQGERSMHLGCLRLVVGLLMQPRNLRLDLVRVWTRVKPNFLSAHAGYFQCKCCDSVAIFHFDLRKLDPTLLEEDLVVGNLASVVSFEHSNWGF